MGWNRRVRPIETSLGYVLRSVRASACVGNARAVTECPLYLRGKISFIHSDAARSGGLSRPIQIHHAPV